MPTETIQADLYDYPKYYDLVFGSDWKAEYDFLEACFERFARGPVRRLFEPACGTGRLLIKFGQAGYDVSGLDLCEKAVEYCNARFHRHGLAPAAWVGDMSDFRLPRKIDAAFNMINSFRHLDSERAAQDHLRCVAAALKTGGLYVLGLHLTPRGEQACSEESWSARRGNLVVNSHLWSIDVDRRRRRERVGMTFDVYTPTRHLRIRNRMSFRTYSAAQFGRLLESVPELEVAETYDFSYEIDRPVKVDRETEDVVYVMRRK